MIVSTRISLKSIAAYTLMSMPVAAQTPALACGSQQSLEQALMSSGEIVPDDCRPVRLSRLTSEGRDLCLLDLSQTDDGLIGSLRDVATQEQWWLDCNDLADEVMQSE